MARLASEIIYKLVADEKDLVKGLKAAEKKTEETAKKFTDLGKKLTLGLTAPIVGVGALMVKLASDAEETASKFDAVFKDQSETVKAWNRTYSESVGRSAIENMGFLATIQDTLVPLGFLRDRAAEMSQATIELATDLASFNNLNTADVVRDIQSALVGNTETLRKYGVVASQEAIVQEALNSGLIETANQLDATSKAQAIYNLIVKGTADAQGDATRTAGSTANQLKALQSRTTELLVLFGNELLPVVNDLVGALIGAVNAISNLDEGTKRTILVAAGFAAALGPVLIGVGKAITAFGTLKVATIALNAALLANPLIATGAAVAAGIALVAGAFIIAADNSKKAASEAEKLNTILSGGTTGNLKDDLDIINKKLEETRKAWAAAQDPRVPERSRIIIREQLADYNKISESLTKQLLAAERIQPTQRQITAAAQQESKAKEDTEKAAARLLETENKYKEARERVLSILAEEKTEYQKIQDQINELQQTPWAQGKLEEDRLAAIKKLRSQQEAILIEELRSVEEKARLARDARIAADDAALARKKAIVDEIRGIENEAERKLFEQNATRLQLIQRERDEAIAAAEEKGARTADIAIYYENLIAEEKKRIDEEELKRIQALTSARIDLAKQLYGQLRSIVDQYYKNEISRVEQSTLSEEEKAEKIGKLKEEQAIYSKAVALADIAINTASAIIKAYSDLGPIGGSVAAVAIGTLGLVQAGLVLSEPIPKFAEGGQFIVPPGFNNDSFPMLVQSGERVTVETPSQQKASGGKNVFQIGTVIADPAGLRELDRVLRKYGTVEDIREGV